MSDHTGSISPALREYLAAHTQADDAFLTELKAAAREAGIPQIWIAPEQASFLQTLVRASGAREVVEVGTLAGYSAITFARALPEGGRVRTIEFEPKHADFAEEWLGRSDAAGRVEVLRGDAREVLPELEAGGTDLFFMDADKTSYPAYLDHALRLLRPGGLLVVDNAFAFGHLLDESVTDDSVLAVRAFNDLVHACDQLDAGLVPLGDGMWVGTRR